MKKPGIIHELIRSYTFYSPIQKGKHRLSDLAFRFSPSLPAEIIVKTTDNRKLLINTANSSYKYIYFLGEYEKAITSIFKRIVGPGDICLDIGANIGWYTTLFQKLVGENGQVHAFEPVPPAFENLQRNAQLNSPPHNIKLNNFALGNEEKPVVLHVFSGLPSGHASISAFDHSDFQVFPSLMRPLDSYISENALGDVSFVKIDVEGAELMVLKGASKLFEQDRLPVLEIEMALATTTGFGYMPNDLIEFIRYKADYDFYSIDEEHFSLKQIEGFDSSDIGANVLCLPCDFDKGKISDWLS